VALVTLFGMICQVKEDNSEIITAEIKILCAQAYVKMLSLEGSISYSVFNPFAFRTVLNIVKQFATQEEEERPKKKRKKSLENCPRISTENDDIIEKCETLCQMIGDLLDHFSLSK